MPLRQRTLGWLTLIAVATAPSDAFGCWLTHWLYGRQQPVVAGFTPVVTTNYPPTMAPPGTLSQTYSLQRPAYVDNINLYTGLPPNTSARPIITSPAVSGTSGSVVANRPLIGSPTTASTALPLAARPTVPLAGRFRGLATTSNPFYGTGNVYPSSAYPSSAYPNNVYPNSGGVGTYSSAYPTTAAAGMTSISTTGLPSGSVVPVTPSAAPPRTGGLARFFRSLLGTNYRNSYYSAPVTFYRPVTTVDPMSGTNVTVQRPCTSDVQLLQRTPVRSFSASPQMAAPQAPTTFAPAPQTHTNPCPTTPLNASPSWAAPAAPQPGSLPPASMAPQAAPALPPDAGLSSPSDREPLDQPRIESTRRPLTGQDYYGEQSNYGESDAYGDSRYDYGESQDGYGDSQYDYGDSQVYQGESADVYQNGNETQGGILGETDDWRDSTADDGSDVNRTGSESNEPDNGNGRPADEARWRSRSSQQTPGFSRAQVARPIPAPDDFRSPFQRRPASRFDDHLNERSGVAGNRSVEFPPLTAPPLPTASPRPNETPWGSQRPSSATPNRSRSLTPALEASLIRPSSAEASVSASHPQQQQQQRRQQKPESEWYVPAR